MLTRCHRGHHAPNIADILPMPLAVIVNLPAYQSVSSFCLSVGLPISQSISQFVYIFPFRLFVCQTVILAANLRASLSVCLLFCVPICQSMLLSVYLADSMSARVRIVKFMCTSFSARLSIYLSYFCRLCHSVCILAYHVCLSTCVPVGQSVWKTVCLAVCLPIRLSV